MPLRFSASRRARGFTLWEIIAVVAVIVIGTTLLFPFLARLTDRGNHKSSCQNNLKQISIGFKQYINDFSERFPLVVVTDAATTTGLPPYGWADALQPYLKNDQVFQCPDDSNQAATYSNPGYSDYWYNANFVLRMKNKQGATIFTGANESVLGGSSQTVIAGDGGNTTETPTGTSRYNQCGDGSSLSGRNQICAPQPTGLATYPAAQLHLEGANFAFADGHVKWYRGKNASQCAQVMGNRATQASIGGNATFSLLSK